MIRVVIFDIGGVIIPNLGKQLYVEAGKAFNLDPMLVRKVFKKFEPEASIGHATFSKMLELMAKEVGVDPEKLKGIFRHLTHTKFIPLPKMTKLVEDLKKRGYKVAVLSNTVDLLADIHYAKGHYKNFHHVFLSHELGMAKPDLKIYKHVIEKLGVKPEECVFIDDHEENLIPARQLGMHAILFQTVTQCKRDLEKLL